MKLEQSFTVTAPVEQVWAMLVDVERVAPCLPGAEITGQSPDGGYEGSFSVKLGPATAAYRGSLKMDSLDEASRTATMHANGTDKRGQGGAHAVIVSTLRQEGDETTVDVVTDFSITGRLARFGRGGMIEDISKRLMRDFAQCLQATLAAEQEAGAAPAGAEPAAAAEPAAPEPAAAGEPEPPAAAEPAAPEPPAFAAEEPAPTPPAPPAPEPPAAEPAPAAEEQAAAAEAAADAPLPGQEAPAEEPLQPAQAPWPPRAPEPEEAAPAEPPAPAPAEPAPAAEQPPPAEAPAAAPGLAAEPEPLPGDAEPAGEAAPPPAATPPPPRTGSVPPPTAPRPAAQPAKPVKGLSLLFGVLWDRIKRFFGRLFGRKREN